MNLSTNDYKPNAFLTFNNSVGSFNSLKNNIQFGTGLLKNKFTFDGRLSKITTDGYMDRATSDLKSVFLSGTYWGNNSSLRLNVFSGKEKTYQAWYGVPEELMTTNRTYILRGWKKKEPLMITKQTIIHKPTINYFIIKKCILF
jgi:iron complex outermembrane receptor protein